MTLSKRGARKVMIAPDGGRPTIRPTQLDNTLIKAVARAYRWKRMLESGTFNSVSELAACEKINSSYLARILRLSLLAPTIIDAILDGRIAPGKLDGLLHKMPLIWTEQCLTNAPSQ